MSKVIPIRLSHSTLEVTKSCERKFQQDKLLENGTKDETEHTVFGKAYGVGIAAYFVTQDRDKAIFHAWLAYWPILETDKKNEVRLVTALEASFSKADNLLIDYEVAIFNMAPAVELSFRLNISTHYYFVGYIDIVLRNRWSGIYAVLDAKTTGLLLFDIEPLYKLSGQTIGYSIALDKIVGKEQASYKVIYFVAQLMQNNQTKIQVLEYPKTLLDRLQWFMTLGMDIKHLELCESLNFYPRRSSACLSYNRPCRYFGTCHMSSMDVPKKREEDTIQYDFVYELDELIADHVRRTGISAESNANETTNIEVKTTSSGIIDLDS